MTSEPWVLGISASHNGACCLLRGDRVVVAIQEERLTGLKRARVFAGRPALGIRYCLDAAGIGAEDLDLIAIASQRSSQLEENDSFLNAALGRARSVPRHVVSHHRAHAASTLATSGFDHAAVLVVDGMGSPVTDLSDADRRVAGEAPGDASEYASLYGGSPDDLDLLEVHTTGSWLGRRTSGMRSFGSLGGLFAAAADQIFGSPDDAGKVMGLAPYGEATTPPEALVAWRGDTFVFPNTVQRHFPHDRRWPDALAEYENLAASCQAALDAAMVHLAQRLYQRTGSARLCLAGGVALNSVTNQRIVEQSGFSDVHIVPAADDSGVALGAAYLGLWSLRAARPRPIRIDTHGRAVQHDAITRAIEQTPGVRATRPEDVHAHVAERLAAGAFCGWVQGGSEFGPRALGNRSILCVPGGGDVKDALNARVKFREAFRPFAPSILVEHAEAWMDFGQTSSHAPFMLRVVPFRPAMRDRLPAVVHVDGTGRVQTVDAEDNPSYHQLIREVHARTGVPVVLNTSFNVRGEPIVETPTDALWCLLGTGLDLVVLHDTVVEKDEGFRSVLDWVPHVCASRYTLDLGVRDGRMHRDLSHEHAVTMHVDTPWGPTPLPLPLRLLPLVSKIDGARTGHALVAALEADPSLVLRDLLLLRRMRVIEIYHVA